MKILLTGFEKFLNYDTNPTETLVNELDKTKHDGKEIIGRVIKLEYHSISDQIRKLIDEINPDVLIMTGQAGRRTISIEKVAINYADSNSQPYNCGTVVVDEILQSKGPDSIFSKLPVTDLVENLQNNNIPCNLSLTAGSYGCNQIFYEALFYLNTIKKDIAAGFIHIPMIPEQSVDGKYPTLDYEIIKKGVLNIIRQI